MPAGADGVFTSGGSAGNLTALLAARQARAGFDVWSDGNAGGAAAGLPLLRPRRTTRSVARCRSWAWGRRPPGRCRWTTLPPGPAQLPAARRAAEARGRRVIGVVASACSTATGAFDPLEAIADFCERGGLWLHVDGAHGASARFSDRHRSLVQGIARADSVVWDAHKLMLMPALVTAVIFRDGRRSYEAFAQQASYLFADVSPEQQWFNLAGRTLECTKLMMSLKVYAALALHGPAFFGGYVDGMFALAQAFADALEAAPDFELAAAPAGEHRLLPPPARRCWRRGRSWIAARRRSGSG